MLAGLGVAALLLAAVGVYGIVSLSVERRAREIAVRAALGARTGRVLFLALRQGIQPVAAGVGIGVAVALALTRHASAFLYRVPAADALTFGSCGLLLIAASAAAAYKPARRATKIDPMQALRHE
jgi:ABC-type antimicrobial peptide transport system permease subunit